MITVAPALFCAPGALLLGHLCGRATHPWLPIQDFELDAAFDLGILKGTRMRRLAYAWERRILQGFDVVSSISGSMVRRAVAKGVVPQKAVLLPNWVDLAAIQPQGQEQRKSNSYRQELGIGEQDLDLLYPGSMNKKQGLQLLVSVILTVSDLPNLVWLLAGEGPTKAELAAALEHHKGVRLLPLQPAERMNDWLNLADVHLLPQKGEAADLVLPSKLLGILASGRPVVASSPAESELGQLAEQAGVRVEPDDAQSFAEGVRRLVREPALRAQLGRQARQLAEERFSQEVVMHQLEGLLVTLCANSSGCLEVPS